MPRTPPDVIHSFSLRFGRELREASSVWRADIWRQQQSPGDEAVADPEAFERLRSGLHGFPRYRGTTDTRKDHPDDGGEEADSHSAESLQRLLATIRRKLRNLQP